MIKLPAFSILACLVFSCATPAPDRPMATADPDRAYPVLGHLKTKDFHVTISSGPGDIVYTVKKQSGEIIIKNIGIDVIQANFPDIHRILDTSYADRNGRILDARVE
jgi:hypothetical protein